MSLRDVLVNGIATAHTILNGGGMEASVTHTPWTGQDGYGADTFGAPVPRRAIVDMTRKPRVTRAGKLLMTIAEITFLEPITDNGASGRDEPIDTRDKIVLPDGSTGPIVSVGGPVDPVTGRPYLNTVLLGDQGDTSMM